LDSILAQIIPIQQRICGFTRPEKPKLTVPVAIIASAHEIGASRFHRHLSPMGLDLGKVIPSFAPMIVRPLVSLGGAFIWAASWCFDTSRAAKVVRVLI
jgi:hypothetical protein